MPTQCLDCQFYGLILIKASLLYLLANLFEGKCVGKQIQPSCYSTLTMQSAPAHMIKATSVTDMQKQYIARHDLYKAVRMMNKGKIAHLQM